MGDQKLKDTEEKSGIRKHIGMFTSITSIFKKSDIYLLIKPTWFADIFERGCGETGHSNWSAHEKINPKSWKN